MARLIAEARYWDLPFAILGCLARWSALALGLNRTGSSSKSVRVHLALAVDDAATVEDLVRLVELRIGIVDQLIERLPCLSMLGFASRRRYTQVPKRPWNWSNFDKLPLPRG